MSYALARSPIPCLSPTFVSFLQARQRSGTLASTPGLLGHPVRLFRVADKETSGSPKFPDYPFECMPRSSTPVVSSVLALSHLGLLPSTRMTVSAFRSVLGRTLSFAKHCFAVHNFTNFEALSRGLHPRSPWLRTSVTGFARRVRY